MGDVNGNDFRNKNAVDDSNGLFFLQIDADSF